MTTIAPLLSQWPRASWQFLAIAPLEMVHAVETGATAPFDLQEEVGSLAHDNNQLRLSAKVDDSYFAEVEGIAKLIYKEENGVQFIHNDLIALKILVKDVSGRMVILL